MNQEIIVGVDIGGTSIKGGCIENKEIKSTFSLPTDPLREAGEILDTLYTVIEKVILPGTLAIGVGVPGLLDTSNGKILNISNIPAWKNFPLKQKIEERFNIPVFINNDANCFALGEKHFGKGQNYSDMLAIALGTGVGGGVIINDKIHSGLYGGAGEVGCWPYKDDIFETYCGSKFFIEKNNTTGKELYDKAMNGDAEAINIFEEYGRHLGKLIKNILYILAPEAIIFGGSISNSFALFKNGIQKELDSFPFAAVKDKIVIEKSDLEGIGILGAAALYYNNK